VKSICAPTHISGFFYDHPMPEVPELTHCGEGLVARGHSVAVHSHTGFEFHYLSRGGCFGWRVGGQEFQHRVGEVIVNYPDELHSSDLRVWPETYFLWVGLKLNAMGAEGRRVAKLLTGKRCRLISACHEMEPVLRGMIAQILSARPRRDTAVRSYLQTLIVLLEQRILSANCDLNAVNPAVPYSHGTIRAVAYLKENLDRRIPLSEIAAASASPCRSVTNFCTRFHREVGVSPATYHRRLRLESADRALRQSALTVTQAAFQFGFNSSQHFSACFRQEFGRSPSQARRGH
jgi:AraC-like DNA-binding protein